MVVGGHHLVARCNRRRALRMEAIDETLLQIRGAGQREAGEKAAVDAESCDGDSGEDGDAEKRGESTPLRRASASSQQRHGLQRAEATASEVAAPAA